MSKHENKSSNHIVDTLDLPKDFIYGCPLLDFVGNQHLVIENHRGLLMYDAEQIAVSTKNYVIRILGMQLHIDSYTDDMLEISGNIQELRFQAC